MQTAHANKLKRGWTKRKKGIEVTKITDVENCQTDSIWPAYIRLSCTVSVEKVSHLLNSTNHKHTEMSGGSMMSVMLD